MDFLSGPHRCPKCHALVVDRRSAQCTTCRADLPAEWIISPQQAAKIATIDRNARAEHLASMKTLDSIKSSSEIPI